MIDMDSLRTIARTQRAAYLETDDGRVFVPPGMASDLTAAFGLIPAEHAPTALRLGWIDFQAAAYMLLEATHVDASALLSDMLAKPYVPAESPTLAPATVYDAPLDRPETALDYAYRYTSWESASGKWPTVYGAAIGPMPAIAPRIAPAPTPRPWAPSTTAKPAKAPRTRLRDAQPAPF